MPPKFVGPAQPGGAPKPPAQPNPNQGRPLPIPPPAKNPIVPLQPAAQKVNVALPNPPPATSKVEGPVANKPFSQDGAAAPKQGGGQAPNQNFNDQGRRNIQSPAQDDPKLATGGQPGTQSSVPQTRRPLPAPPPAAGPHPVGAPPSGAINTPVGAPPSISDPVHSVGAPGAPPPAVKIAPVGAPPRPARLPAAGVGAPPSGAINTPVGAPPSISDPVHSVGAPGAPPPAGVGAPPSAATNTPVATRPAIPFKRAKQTGDLTDRATDDNVVIGSESQGQYNPKLGEPPTPSQRGWKWQLIGDGICTAATIRDPNASRDLSNATVFEKELMEHDRRWQFVRPGATAQFAISFTVAVTSLTGKETSREVQPYIDGNLALYHLQHGGTSGSGPFTSGGNPDKFWHEFGFDHGNIWKLREGCMFLDCGVRFERNHNASRALKWHLWHLRRNGDDQPLGNQDPMTNGFDETSDRLRRQNAEVVDRQLAAQAAADNNYAEQ